MLTLVRVCDDWPDDIDILAETAAAEGYQHIARLKREWQDGSERFVTDGCVLLMGYASGADGLPRPAAVGGLTRDPVLPSLLRMRRFYVAPEFRHLGYGRSLATALIQEAQAGRTVLTVHTTNNQARVFCESLGFTPVDGPNHTHELHWSQRPGNT
jgi:GNAT superfamily N-acetyltransferase